MDFRPITLSDRPVFELAYRQCRHEGSECSFTNLFIWQEPLELYWTQIGRAVCVVALNDGPVYALHPCAEEAEDAIAAARALAEWFGAQGKPLLIRGLEQPLAEMLGKAFPNWRI